MSIIDGGNAYSTFNDAPNTGSYGDSTRTVLEVQQSVKRSFGDESGVQLSDTDIIRWINDAADEIVKRNRILKAAATVQSVVGQQDYSFPSQGILQIEALHYAGVRLPNMAFAQAEEQVIGQADTGEPILWYEWGGKFSFYPVPPTSQIISIYYTRAPNRVSLSTDSIPVSDKYYNDVVRYVLQQAYEMQEDPQMSQIKGQQFDASLAAMGEEEREAQNMTYPSVTILDFEQWRT